MGEEDLFNKNLKQLIKYRNLIVKSKYKNIFASEENELKTYFYEINVWCKSGFKQEFIRNEIGTFTLPHDKQIKKVHLGQIELCEETLFYKAQKIIQDLSKIEKL